MALTNTWGHGRPLTQDEETAMLTLSQRRRIAFKNRKEALIRGFDPAKPREVTTFVRQYRDLILEYADVLPSAHVAWARAINVPAFKVHSSNTREDVQ